MGGLTIFIIAGFIVIRGSAATKRVRELTLNVGREKGETEGDRENDEPMIFPGDAHVGTRQNGILN